MKKKKKRKSSPPEDEPSNMVASNVDPSLMVRVPYDNRISVDDVLDKTLQLEVEKWSEIDPSLAGMGSCGCPAGNDVGLVAPQTGYVVALSSETEVVSHVAGDDRTQVVSKCATVSPDVRSQVGNGSIGAGLVAPQTANDVQTTPQLSEGIAVISESMAAKNVDGGNKSQTVPVLRPRLGSGTSSDGSQKAPLAGMNLVFKAGSSGSGSEAKATGSNVRGPKFAGAMLQRARKPLLRGSDARLGAGSAPKRPNPPTPLPIRPEAAVPRVVPAGPPEGAKLVDAGIILGDDLFTSVPTWVLFHDVPGMG
ncbi:hypothetical protein LIER_18699 [Lithospermum erythrorhizon]|uniref:Uncharacterized protein n=1 Tax=Lithospermum erythrorhizon TaxID=34254 RepID=A0AAV3QHL5_LITER